MKRMIRKAIYTISQIAEKSGFTNCKSRTAGLPKAVWQSSSKHVKNALKKTTRLSGSGETRITKIIILCYA